MSLPAECNPLKTVWLPGGVELSDPTGIIVIVGPNSSGKTLFLRDIERCLRTGKHHHTVCEGLAVQKPADCKTFLDALIAARYVEPTPENPQQYRFCLAPLTPIDSQGSNPRNPFDWSSLKKAFDDFTSERAGNNPHWFGHVGMTLVSELTLDHRRAVCDKSQGFNYKKDVPNTPSQSLYLHSDAQERLAEETGNIFGNAVWLDISENNVVQLRASGAANRPSHGEMNNPLRASSYRSIDKEGDGYRSYVGICLSLLLAARPVTLIDEPELCLHPPQAYHIGRFIGRYASIDHVTFVATHSSQVLRGILETGKKVTVVRLTRRNGRFSARLVDKVAEAVRNPRTRAETVLDGIFAKGVVLVESEGDREEYQAAAERIENYPAREVQFIPVGGTGGFAAPLGFFRTLDLPTAVIMDLDGLCDIEKVAPVTSHLMADSSEIVNELRHLVQLIKALPPNMTENDAKDELKRLAGGTWDWKQDGDNQLRRKLNELEGRLKRVRKLKEGGIEAYRDRADIHTKLLDLVERFAKIGLFFVPVGELEDWIKHLMVNVPKHGMSKTDRAAIAADRIRVAQEANGDVWAFVKRVCDFLQPG